MSKFLNFDTNINGAEDSMLKAFGDIRAFLLVIISGIQREAYSVCDTIKAILMSDTQAGYIISQNILMKWRYHKIAYFCEMIL